jgi:hypothetical protein
MSFRTDSLLKPTKANIRRLQKVQRSLLRQARAEKMKRLDQPFPEGIINMADWLTSHQTRARSGVRDAFYENRRLSRRTPVKTSGLTLSQGQCRTILDRISLPDELFARLLIEEFEQGTSQFTVEDLFVLQDKLEEAAYYAKRIVRWKLMCVVEKLSNVRSKFQKVLGTALQFPDIGSLPCDGL